MDTIPITMILGEIGVFLVIPILVVILFNLWMHYRNALFLNSIEWVLLEIVPPKEVHKSPEAMELVLNSLYGGGYGNWYERYWKGELAQFYSLEIVSIEGKIHYYVRFAKKFRKVFEAQLYSQYPQAQVIEVPIDYVTKVPKLTRKDSPIGMWAYNVELAKDEVYPIKSYIDFGMDRAVGSLEEEQKIDPMSPMLEIMGSIGIGEQIWFQINMRQVNKRFVVKKDDKEEPGQAWQKKADQVINELRKKINPPDKEGKVSLTPSTKGQLALIEAIERHKNKNAFECGIRVLYVAKKEHLKGDSIGAYTAMLRQFASDDMNSFKLSGLTKPSPEPWKDMLGINLFKMKRDALEDYKARKFFYGSFNFKKIKRYFEHPANLGGNPFILTTEELATLFHLPGRVIETPTFTRQDSTKSEPPANLPI
ncbi:MAG: hypothetical protein WCQ32_02330 [bacterium]